MTRHYAVNWTDGMKVSRQHFVAQENYFTNRISDSLAAQIHSFDYGLLPAPVLNQFSNEFGIHTLVTGEVEVTLRKLDALSPGGFRITVGFDEVTPEMRFTITSPETSSAGSMSAGEQGYLVLLQADPFEKQPVGPLNAAEMPHRHPYTAPTLYVSLLPESQFNPAYPGGYFIVLGRVARRGGSLAKDEAFVPPCTSIRSHPVLMRFYEALGGAINEIQQNALSIIQKIKSRTQQTDLSRNIQRYCEDTISAVSQLYFRFRNVTFHLAPIYCMEDLSGLAGRVFNNVQTLSEKDKEEMLKYFFEWCDVAPSQLEAQLSGAIEMKYEHTRLAAHMQQLEELLRMLAHILTRLNRLEYIGIRKENIVVKEEVVTQTTKTKKGWSLLD